MNDNKAYVLTVLIIAASVTAFAIFGEDGTMDNETTKRLRIEEKTKQVQEIEKTKQLALQWKIDSLKAVQSKK